MSIFVPNPKSRYSENPPGTAVGPSGDLEAHVSQSLALKLLNRNDICIYNFTLP
jgi:hypothetical protein